jgi:hypothetical protein
VSTEMCRLYNIRKLIEQTLMSLLLAPQTGDVLCNIQLLIDLTLQAVLSVLAVQEAPELHNTNPNFCTR